MTNIPLRRHFSRQWGGSYQHHNFSHKYEPPPMQFFPFLLLPSFTVYLAISIAMLSSVSAVFASVEPMPVSPFQSFENGFPPWDCFDPFSSSPHQSPKPDGSSSGSDKSIQSDQNPDNSNSNSGSDDPNPQVSVIDERKRRRMISNRESARRSRMRKQKHVENLRNQVNQLRIENRELTNRLRFVLYHSHGVRTDYDRLQSEYSTLRKKLSDMSQILMTRQLQQFTSEWPCNNMITTSTEQVAPSLITS